MKKKIDPEDFYKQIEIFSNQRIANKEDLKRLLTALLEKEEHSLLEEISFNAKYIAGLLRIIKSRRTEFQEEYFKKITNEYKINVEKLRKRLLQASEISDKFFGGIIREKYLAMTQESLNNLNSLCEDLSWVKMYLNSISKKTR